VVKRRLEETLEECLAALARGQSTVQECLALYPELAAELEPLLHTAGRVQKAYAADPSPLYAQAARERFLAGMARRRQRRLVARPARPSWRWVPAALGSAAVVAFAAWASVLALAGGGGSQAPRITVAQITPASTPVPTSAIDIQEQVARVQAQLEQIRTGAESGALEPVAIQQLKEDTAVLVASLDQTQALEPEAVSQIHELFTNQEKVLSEVKESVSAEAAEDVDEIIKIAGAGRAKVEELLSPSPTPTPSATPSATPTATPEESPTSAATPTATPSATVTPEVTPTEAPQPTPSPPSEGGEEPSPTATAAP
jgi:DNA polymerase III gamma/tau subunit